MIPKFKNEDELFQFAIQAFNSDNEELAKDAIYAFAEAEHKADKWADEKVGRYRKQAKKQRNGKNAKKNI